MSVEFWRRHRPAGPPKWVNSIRGRLRRERSGTGPLGLETSPPIDRPAPRAWVLALSPRARYFSFPTCSCLTNSPRRSLDPTRIENQSILLSDPRVRVRCGVLLLSSLRLDDGRLSGPEFAVQSSVERRRDRSRVLRGPAKRRPTVALLPVALARPRLVSSAARWSETRRAACRCAEADPAGEEDRCRLPAAACGKRQYYAGTCLVSSPVHPGSPREVAEACIVLPPPGAREEAGLVRGALLETWRAAAAMTSADAGKLRALRLQLRGAEPGVLNRRSSVAAEASWGALSKANVDDAMPLSEAVQRWAPVREGVLPGEPAILWEE